MVSAARALWISATPSSIRLRSQRLRSCAASGMSMPSGLTRRRDLNRSAASAPAAQWPRARRASARLGAGRGGSSHWPDPLQLVRHLPVLSLPARLARGLGRMLERPTTHRPLSSYTNRGGRYRHRCVRRCRTRRCGWFANGMIARTRVLYSGQASAKCGLMILGSPWVSPGLRRWPARHRGRRRPGRRRPCRSWRQSADRRCTSRQGCDASGSRRDRTSA